MAQRYLGKVFGDGRKAASSIASDDDFDDFATPSPAAPAAAESAAPAAESLTFLSVSAAPTGLSQNLNGPWYAVWERSSLSDFKVEGYVVLLLIFIIGSHVWGTRRNRAIARNFFRTISPVLSQEFAHVGFDYEGTANTEGADASAVSALRENHPLEFITYASGRQNIAFVHATIKLQRRSNPVGWLGEHLVSFFFETLQAPTDSVTFTISPFDGQDAARSGSGQSSKYDNFVWALVNKNNMKRWRDDRYDLSLTKTTDWEGLPPWLAVMGESKEIGDIALSKDLKEAVQDCQDILEYLIVTDQPVEKPTSLAETVPKKRITLQLNMPPSGSSTAIPKLLRSFIRLTDHLVSTAHFRSEVLRKVKALREDEIKKLQRQADEEKAEQREAKRAEDKKSEREKKLRGMNAEEQRRFLEREREKEGRKAMKRQTKRA